MRKLFLLIAVALLGIATASASTLCVDLTGQNVLSLNFYCEAAGLTFSNFQATGPERVDLMQVSIIGSTVNLTFNPNIVAGGSSLDRYFYMTVSGGVLGVDLINGGATSTSIYERICSSPVDIGSGNICSEGGTQLGEMTVAGGSQNEVTFGQSYPNVYIYKDLYVDVGGHLSSLTQSVETGVPEPLTFGLIGSGLVLLGLLRRRARG